MATTSTELDAPVDAVFRVLCDPETYPRWLVGARRIRSVDPGFPRPGTSFHHEVGAGPVRIRDCTTAVEHDPADHRLVLRVRARPVLGAALADMRALPLGQGRTRVTIEEEPRRIPLRRITRPIAERLIQARNRRSLQRLRHLLEGDCAGPLRKAAAGSAG